jgi:TolB-like protein/Flp pilus assembly protein TadD
MPVWSAEIKELETLYTSLKGRFPELEKDLEHLIKTDDENVALLYSRRCLEIIITDLCESELKRPRKTEPLKGIIDKLRKEDKVPSHIITSMHGLNDLSTYGTHPKEFDPEQVRPILLNLATIIKWYVKYKDTQSAFKGKPKEVKYESKEPVDTSEGIQKPKKKFILLLSGLLMVVAIFVVVLFVFNIIGGGKQTKALDKSIAVLPFKLLSDEPDKQYLADGMMDAILLHLSKIEDLRVMSRTSTEQYREPGKTMTEIGRELGVSYLLEGSFQKYGDDARLIVQLIKTGKEGHVWANEYDRKWDDILFVQSEVAQAIASELHAVITPEEKQIIEKIPTENLEAYENYLIGLHYYNKDTEADLLQAIDYYKKAADQDPEFALAYTGIAMAYISLIWKNWLPEDVYPKAREAAIKALEINDQLSEAHVALASVKLYYDWHLKEAEKELNQAISLNPNNSGAYNVYSTLLDISCRFEEALEKYKQAMALNPNSEEMRFIYGFKLYRAFAVDSAILIMKKGVENDPLNAFKHYFLGYIYLQDGNYKRAIEELERAVELDPIPQPYYFYLGIAYNKAGRPDETKKILDKLNILEKKNRKVSLGKAILLAELGETDKAIYWLKKAYEERHQYLLYLKSVPVMCSSIRQDPRFLEIYHRIWPEG